MDCFSCKNLITGDLGTNISPAVPAYCSPQCVIDGVAVADIARFLENIKVDAISHCWTWVGPYTAGRGTMKVEGEAVNPMRFALRAWRGTQYGKNAPAMTVYTACRNPLCVRPDHAVVMPKGLAEPDAQHIAFVKKYGLDPGGLTAGYALARLDQRRIDLPTCRRCFKRHDPALRFCYTPEKFAAARRSFEKQYTEVPGGHYIWTGKTSTGDPPQGLFYAFGRTLFAHRAAYAFYRDFDLNSSLVIRHVEACREPLCVAHDHMEPVARATWLKNNKLTKEQIEDMRDDRFTDNLSYAELGSRYGVSATAAWNHVARRRTR